MWDCHMCNRCCCTGCIGCGGGSAQSVTQVELCFPAGDFAEAPSVGNAIPNLPNFFDAGKSSIGPRKCRSFNQSPCMGMQSVANPQKLMNSEFAAENSLNEAFNKKGMVWAL